MRRSLMVVFVSVALFVVSPGLAGAQSLAGCAEDTWETYLDAMEEHVSGMRFALEWGWPVTWYFDRIETSTEQLMVQCESDELSDASASEYYVAYDERVQVPEVRCNVYYGEWDIPGSFDTMLAAGGEGAAAIDFGLVTANGLVLSSTVEEILPGDESMEDVYWREYQGHSAGSYHMMLKRGEARALVRFYYRDIDRVVLFANCEA